MNRILCLKYYVFIYITLIKLIYADDDPILNSWIKSNGMGYSDIVSNVDKVEYNNEYVYIHTSGIPSYEIGLLFSFFFELNICLNNYFCNIHVGPWSKDANTPRNIDSIYKFIRNPSVAERKTKSPLGTLLLL